jgi:hypothetical protein
MIRRPTRPAIRSAVPLLLLASCAGGAIVSLRTANVPTLALGSQVVLALQIALAFFYGSLLLLVPLLRALDGDLPIELSLRGARWSEEFRGVGDELAARQKNEEMRSDRIESNLREQVQALGEQVELLDRSQKKFFRETAAKVAAFEEKV